MEHASEKAKNHLKVEITPRWVKLRGFTPDSLPVSLAQSVPATRKAASGSGSGTGELELELRMRPVDRSDKAVGRVVKAFGIDGSWRGRYRLRMPDMTESDRSYSASELVETFFDPKVDLKGRDLLPAPGSLIGCSVHVWFLPDADSTQGGAYWPGVLKRVDKGWSPPTGGLAGWFFCHYEDSIEPLFIGLRADGTSTYAACAPCDANHLHSHLHDVCNAKANVRIAHGGATCARYICRPRRWRVHARRAGRGDHHQRGTVGRCCRRACASSILFQRDERGRIAAPIKSSSQG
jgi:hypothetical protein